MDLALTCTYFPHCGLTFAIIFGCTLALEEEILNRLSYATEEASHPLLLPGIIAELERLRHISVVEHTIDTLETHIFELDFKTSDMDGVDEGEVARKNFEKRNAWLDTSYLGNQLVSWKTQLDKVAEHATALRYGIFKKPMMKSQKIRLPGRGRMYDSDGELCVPSSDDDETPRADQVLNTTSEPTGRPHPTQPDEIGGLDDWVPVSRKMKDRGRGGRPLSAESFRGETGAQTGQEHQRGGKVSFTGELIATGNQNRSCMKADMISDGGSEEIFERETPNIQTLWLQRDPAGFRKHMRRTGHKIGSRLQAIIDEYDDKIRDCRMRVDGMAMATQWVIPLFYPMTSKECQN